MFKANVWARDSELNVLEKKKYDMLALCAFLEVKLVLSLRFFSKDKGGLLKFFL